MRIGKTLALLLSCALLLTMFPSVEGYAVDRQSEPVSAVSDVALYAAGWQKKPTKTVSSASNFPITLNNGDVLQINGTINYTASTGVSPITVAANATVSIIINGSVTLHGANASGKTGATAAIKVPSSSKLYIYSAHDEELSTSTAAPKDTLTVTGGNAAAGTNGTDAERRYTKVNSNAIRYDWYTGSGGAGGGGAAAAIGGNGGTGGAGASGWKSTNKDGKEIYVTGTTGLFSLTFHNHDDNPGKAGAAGSAGTAGTGTGTIYIPGRLTLVAKGGSAAAGGKGGSGCEGMYTLSGNDEMIGGNGGGGGGGGGCAAPAIGAGGAGGSGGGSGGQLSSDHKGKISGCGGGGGGGGWPNGGGGGGGGTTASECGSGANHDGGAGGNGGAAGSAGSAGSSGRTANSAVGSTASGGSGGGGVQSGAASGGSGGVRVQNTSAYPGGKGGNGGGAVPYTAWHTKGSLTLSTANKLNLNSSMGLAYHYGDGQGYGSSTYIIPNIVYDLMDCTVSVNGTYTYTGAQIKPTYTVTYSAASDRDRSRVSHGTSITINSNGYTAAYGENIHCPTGTVALTGKADASRNTATADGSIVGTKTQTFTIKKAQIKTVDMEITPATSDASPLPFQDGFGHSDTAKIRLKNYTSTAQYDTNKDIGELKLTTPSTEPGADQAWQGWFIVSWAESDDYTVSETWVEDACYNFVATRGGKFTPQIKLSNMNDFEDFTAAIKTITVDKPLITGTLSSYRPHPRQPVTVTIPADAGNVTYQWYIDNTKIAGATTATYTPTNSDIGKWLSVHVIPTDANSPYKNMDEVTVGSDVYAHSYTNNNGFCTVCGEYETPTLNNGFYEINNGGKLFWFASYVNGDPTHVEEATSKHLNINARLTSDISLHNPKNSGATEWTPIGETSGTGTNAFAGTFDGQGHTISDLSITTLPSGAVRTGLFGTTYGGVVKDFTIKGSITLSAGNKGDNSGIGGAIGATKYGTAVSGVTSYVNISNTSANALVHVGGVVGELYSSTAKQCLYFGSINLQNASDSIGGVVGYINNSEIGYCANLGTVKTATAGAYVGGVLGYLNNSAGKVHNCYNYGSVKNGGGNYCGAIIGWLRGGTASNLTDNYYLRGSASSAFGAGSITTTATAPAKNNSAFAGGEVCYLVNSKTSTGDKALWKQDIDNGKKPYDQYPVFDADPVYFRSDSTYSNDPERISVTLSWGDMEFEYDIGTWEPNTHTYVGGGWSAAKTDGGKLSVSNESNVSLQVQFSFAADSALSSCGLTGSFGGVSTGVNHRMAPNASISTSLNLDSKAPDSIKNAGKKNLGSITVRLTTLGGGT
mgnify:CR=1 FL=1